MIYNYRLSIISSIAGLQALFLADYGAASMGFNPVFYPVLPWTLWEVSGTD
jgi:hypothetical protein